VHHSHAEVACPIRDAATTTTRGVNVMVGYQVSDATPIAPTAGNYATELDLEQFKEQFLPRGSAAGGLYRMNHEILSRNTNKAAVPDGGRALSRYAMRNGHPTAYAFKDSRVYKLHDPLATLTTGGFIEHESEGEFPLTSANNGVPLDCVFLGVWAFQLREDDGAVLGKLPYLYFNVRIVYDVEWYAPAAGASAPVGAASGAGAGLDPNFPAGA